MSRNQRTIGLTVLLLAASFVLLASFARRDPTDPKGVTPRVCHELGGPPNRDLIRCRLMRMSEGGHLPRSLTDADADRVIAALEEISIAKKAAKNRTLTEAAAVERIQGANQVCIDLIGLSCGELLFAPLDPS